MMKKRFNRRGIVLSLFVSGLLLFSVGAYFQPWKLFTDTRVDEALPEPEVIFESSEPTQTETASENEESPAPPVVLATGSFITHEHSTTGTVKILKYADGSRILRIENLQTSDGPKLEVWLTDAPVIKGEAGWRVFDDGKYINLGTLKGNIGNQNYIIPSNINLDDYSSMSIWCERFAVSFGAAQLLIS